MYILTFQRSNSKNFQKALNHVYNLGVTWDGQTARIEIPEDNLLKAYEEIHFLFGYIQNWKSLRATFRGKEVRPFRFIFLVWRNVDACRRECRTSKNPRHCWSSVDAKGWGCKQLRCILRYTNGPAHYKVSNRYWYNFGEFADRDVWAVNKELIFKKLKEESEEKALDLCPHFKINKVKEAIDNLPDFIRVDNSHFANYYSVEYLKGEKRLVPVNIRHVLPPRRMTSIREIILNDPGKYQWN